MRLFQNSAIPPTYRKRLYRLSNGLDTFAARRRVFLDDRFGASHFLAPVLEGDPDAFFTNGDDELLQRAWAREHGLPRSAMLADILLAQIEAHRTEVFYNLDPMRYGGDFVRRLPGCVRRRICWRAAPSPGVDFGAYDLLVCNFPGIIAGWKQRGLPGAYFFPAHDPIMDRYCAGFGARSVDVVFIGGYTRHHARRARILEEVAALAGECRVAFHLDRSRMTRLAEGPLGGLVPWLRRQRRPATIRAVCAEPVFGVDLYRTLASAKIVLNGAIDMAGDDRGNMRCFEALGCGALMVTDSGNYPEGFRDGENMLAYRNEVDAVATIRRVLGDWPAFADLAAAGRAMVQDRYSKAAQWAAFERLVVGGGV